MINGIKPQVKNISFNFVPNLKRETQSEKILNQIFINKPDNLFLDKSDKMNTVLQDASGKVYLKIKKYTGFINDSTAVKESKQAVKCFTREILDAKDNLIKKVKSFYNSEGMYKVEVWDSDGKTLINEVIGTPYYNGFFSPSHKGIKKTYTKPVFNRPLKKESSFERIKYFPSQEKPIERTIFEKKGVVSMIEIPIYENNNLLKIQRLSPKRKLLSTITVNPARNTSNFRVINNSAGWNKYT